VVTSLLSDHHAVEFMLRLTKPHSTRKLIIYHKLKKIDHDVEGLPMVTSPADSIVDLVDQYNGNLGQLLDKHAPLISRHLTVWS
jgi:hypothetical protein